ncbi:MAG: DUF4277 domain-containing protein [Methylococcales bacterium]|nr:DUF4277 domain-containing protein [Methylococcales bacterium]
MDHLGLIAGMVDELDLCELIDTVIKLDQEQRQVSVEQCVKAMILHGLGFVNRAPYLMPHFIKDKPVTFTGQNGQLAAGSSSGQALGAILHSRAHRHQ